MTHESGFWSKVLHKAFDDSEVTQAIVVVQETPLAFRLVQTFQRKKLRVSTPSIAEPPAATYRIDST